MSAAPTTARVEGCACGGAIAADPLDAHAVQEAVAIHRATTQHIEWSQRQGFPAPRSAPQPQPGDPPRDVSEARAEPSAARQSRTPATFEQWLFRGYGVPI